VSDVLNIPVNSIQSTPNFNSKIETDFIRGIGQIDNNMIIILDSDKILSTEEIKTVDSVNKTQQE
jgi:purine-binding chemotaxis protein CheW